MESPKKRLDRRSGFDFYGLNNGGRYLREEFHTPFLGHPFEGLGFIGFNRATNKVEAPWMDIFAGSIAFMDGPFNVASKTLTMVGEVFELSAGKVSKYKGITKIVDQDKYIYGLYVILPDGNDVKVSEIVYTRTGSD